MRTFIMILKLRVNLTFYIPVISDGNVKEKH